MTKPIEPEGILSKKECKMLRNAITNPDTFKEGILDEFEREFPHDLTVYENGKNKKELITIDKVKAKTWLKDYVIGKAIKRERLKAQRDVLEKTTEHPDFTEDCWECCCARATYKEISRIDKELESLK